MKGFNLQTPEIQEQIRIIEKEYNANRADVKRRLAQLMDNAGKSGNSLLLGFTHAYFARIYYVEGDMKKFLSHVRAGIRLTEINEDKDSASICYNLLGVDAMNHGEYPIALEYYEEALNAASSESSVYGAALVNTGHIYYEIGEIDKALYYCKQGRKYLEKSDNPFPLLIELAQEATYSIWSKRLGMARGIIAELKVIEEQLQSRYPDETFTDLSEVLIYYYDTMQQSEKRDAAFLDFADALSNYDGSYIDFAENINWITDTLMNSGKTNFVGRLLNITRKSIMKSGIPHIQLQFLERDIKYQLRIKNHDEVHKLESKYFRVSCLRNRENLRIYKTNISIHNDMNHLREETARIEEENRRLLREASIDPLTQIPNRALLNEKAEYYFSMADQNQVSLGVEMLDIDFFKELNDTYGHQQGDHCLQLVASILKDISCDRIFSARYGGDEFMIIYYDMTDADILKKAEHIRERINQMKIPNINSETSDFLTISQGIRNSVPRDSNRVWDYTYGADNALYKVKKTKKGGILLIHNAVIDRSVLENDSIND
ncbi:MAG: diguanylate cyclase [Lachnospiraceae bacterium]|uniref:Diguanylate cyclase n=1 Tax=Candidatus Weimeria bifida TaxID=2599074 RepID=A0A6N7IZ01_9FIRM|nr:diguanylate cyclase [Candidatus Weimeria bifida]RRF97141.1 MAG: diguanylate cyclase [Lachnospiraceae bacterium]